MSYAAADGAWVSATRVVRIECSKCGFVLVSRWPMNDREEYEACLQHMRDKHNGTYRAPLRKGDAPARVDGLETSSGWSGPIHWKDEV